MRQSSRASQLWWTEIWDDSVACESILRGLDVPGSTSHPLVIRASVSALNETDKVTVNNTIPANNVTSALPKAHKTLVPHWSYEKNSIAVAIVISVVTVIAFVTLSILFVQKVRRSWRRHKNDRNDYASSRYRVYYTNDSTEKGLKGKYSRESVMFGKDDSNDSTRQEYFVEQDGDKITRVYREGKNDSTRTFDSVVSPQIQQHQQPEPESYAPQETPVSASNTVDKADPVSPVSGVQSEIPITVRARSGSFPKPVVVVPPPLKQISSLKAATITQPLDPLPEKRASFIPKSRSEARRSLIKLATDPGLLFRLPSIKKTTSPIYRP